MYLDPEVSRQVYAAFHANDAERFRSLLASHPEFLRNENGTDRWMWKAAMNGSVSLLKVLVELGCGVNETKDQADPEDPFFQAEGAIVQAAGNGHLEVVRWMLEQGAKINYVVQGKPRCLPLTRAASDGHLDVVKLLVEHGADYNATWNGINAITQAEDFGQFHVRDYLHSLGARTLRETTPPDYPRAHKRFLKDLTERVGPLADWKLEVSGDPLVVIRLIPANDQCDMHSLFTVGLSDHPLPQEQRFACTELRCILPRDWPVTETAFSDPLWNWPLEWLKRLVVQLRVADRWPDPALFMNGDPPAPLAPNTELSGWLALKSLGESTHAPDYRWIDIHSLFPIHAEEATLVRESGPEALVSRFQDHKIPLYVDPKRPNMGTL